MNRLVQQSSLHSFLKIISLGMLCVSLIPNTTQASQKQSAFQGLSVGGNAGYGTGRSKEKFQTTVAPAGVFLSARNKNSLEGFDGGINLGYTYVFSCTPIALGIEGIANWSNVKDSVKFSAGQNIPPVIGTFTASLRKKQSFQLAARLGYAFNMVMPYLKLGWDNSSWNYKGNVNLTSPLFPGPILINAKKHKRLNGIVYGAGIDIALHKHFITGLEFTHTNFKGQSVSLAGGSTKGSFKPSMSKFALVMKVIFP